MSRAPNSGMFGHGQTQDYSKRKPRGPHKRTLMLQAIMKSIKEEGTGEELTAEQAEAEYMRIIVERSLDKNDRNNAALAKEVLDRLIPTDKATMPTYEIEFDPDSSASDRIDAIVAAVANGQVPPDVGNMMVNMITAAVKVEEQVELMERLAKLEEMLAELDRE